MISSGMTALRSSTSRRFKREIGKCIPQALSVGADRSACQRTGRHRIGINPILRKCSHDCTSIVPIPGIGIPLGDLHRFLKHPRILTNANTRHQDPLLRGHAATDNSRNAFRYPKIAKRVVGNKKLSQKNTRSPQWQIQCASGRREQSQLARRPLTRSCAEKNKLSCVATGIHDERKE